MKRRKSDNKKIICGHTSTRYRSLYLTVEQVIYNKVYTRKYGPSLDNDEINFRKIENYYNLGFISEEDMINLKNKYNSGSMNDIRSFDNVLNFLSSYGWEIFNVSEIITDSKTYPHKNKIHIIFVKK